MQERMLFDLLESKNSGDTAKEGERAGQAVSSVGEFSGPSFSPTTE